MKSQWLLTGGSFLALIALSGCGSGDDRLKEKAGIEGQISAEKALEVENNNRTKRAQEMEADLQKRHRFYQAVKGTYEGQFSEEGGKTWSIRFTFVPSLPPYQTDRVRAYEEIVADLNNLYLNVQVIQWSSDGYPAAGCKAEHIRPDIDRGEISIATSECPVYYDLALSGAAGGQTQRSSELAKQISEGSLRTVGDIQGSGSSTTYPKPFKFAVSRVVQ